MNERVNEETYVDEDEDEDDFEIEFPPDFLILIRKISKALIQVLNLQDDTGRKTIRKIVDEMRTILKNPVSLNMIRTVTAEAAKTIDDPIAKQILRKIAMVGLQFHQHLSRRKFDFMINNFADGFAQPYTPEIIMLAVNEAIYLSSDPEKRALVNAVINGPTEPTGSAPATNNIGNTMGSNNVATVQAAGEETLQVRNFYKQKPPYLSLTFHSE